MKKREQKIHSAMLSGGQAVTQQELNTAKDKDLIASLAVMKRAAALARQQAIQTGTAIVLLKVQETVRVAAEEINKERKI